MAEEDALEQVQPSIGGKLSYAVGQRQPPAPETSTDRPPMSSRITSDASSYQEEALSEEAMGTRRTARVRRAALRSLSYLEIDSGARDLPEEIGSAASLDRDLSNLYLDAGEEEFSRYITEIADGMEKEFPIQLKKVRVQAKMIYRVPQINRRLDEDAYTPQFVSFGPYHRDTETLRSADKYKWSFFQQIRDINKEAIPLEIYLKEMDRIEQEVKDCYEEDIQMETKTNDGIKMLLLDGFGILGFLGILPLPQRQVEVQTQKQDKVVVEACTIRKYISRIIKKLPRTPMVMAASSGLAFDAREKEIGIAVEGESKRTADSTIITLWHHDSIRHDLLLMENQLPFFVLQKIYDFATIVPTVEESLTLKDKVDRTIQKLLESYPLITTKQSFHHLLHCCHLKFKPAAIVNSSSPDSQPTEKVEPKWRGATDLYKAGIKFKPKLCKLSESLLDLELDSGRTLMIPTLNIEDSTSSVFRNLIAFEQSCTHEKYFVAYAFFMRELMSTPGDVTLLVKEGVVNNYIGADKEVSDFFNNLVKGVVFNVNGKHFLRSTFQDLNSYYDSAGHKHLADLKQNYCGSPWLVISVLAAAIILVCTVVQTVFAVIK